MTSQTDAAADTEPAASTWSVAVRRVAAHPRLAGYLELLAVLPLVATVLEVAKASRLQFYDYWDMLLRITNADGTLHPAGFLELKNEHPLMLPSVLYWLDAKLADGDNRILGYAVVLIAGVTVFALRAALPRTLPPLVRAGIVITLSLLVFSPHGLHNYVRAMSGAAWLTANLLAILAMILAARGRWWPAWAVGLLACASYGTGFAVWPALLVLALLRREAWWRRLVPVGLGALVVISWLLLKPSAEAGSAPASDVGTLLFQFVAVLGHLWTATEVGIAAVAGVAILAGYAMVATTAAGRAPHLRFWWALACYALLASAMIATARVDWGVNLGLASRYTSLSVLASLPLLVLVVSVLRQRPAARPSRLAILAVTVGLAGYALGSPAAAAIRTQGEDDQLQAIALRMGYDLAFLESLPAARELTPRLRAMGHYPFSDRFSLGCGDIELGSRLDLDKIRPLTGPGVGDPNDPIGAVDEVEQKGNAAIVRGWAGGGAVPIQCALMVDGTGRVAGGGDYGRSRPDVAKAVRTVPASVGFAVIGPSAPDCLVVIVLQDGRMLSLPPVSPEKAP